MTTTAMDSECEEEIAALDWLTTIMRGRGSFVQPASEHFRVGQFITLMYGSRNGSARETLCRLVAVAETDRTDYEGQLQLFEKLGARTEPLPQESKRKYFRFVFRRRQCGNRNGK